jgi:hypothetical protein
MTNTINTIKCDTTCIHDINLQGVGFAKVNKTKWHKCQVCQKWQVFNWIVRHEMLCKSASEYLIKKGGLN